MSKEVEDNFVRKQFADFSYITVEPTPTATIVTFIITILLTVGISVFSVMNGVDRISGWRKQWYNY